MTAERDSRIDRNRVVRSPESRAHSGARARRHLVGLALLMVTGASAGMALGEELGLENLREVPLPHELDEASDVRWHATEGLLFADPGSGVVALDLATGRTRVVVPQGSAAHQAYRPVRIASDGAQVAYGFAMYDLGVTRAEPGAAGRKHGFEVIEDIDLFAGRLAVLGLRRDDSRAFAPDGAYLWRVDSALTRDVAVPLLFARGGAGAPAFNNCIALEVGSLRFLAGGELFVIPGAEPGAFLLDPSGKVARVWDGGELGLSVPCASISPLDAELLSANKVPRATWLNAFDSLDEILPVPDGALALVRTASRSGTTWRGVHYRRDSGEAIPVAIPYASPSRFAHLRGDVLDSKLVLLEFDLGDDTLHVARRVVLADWRLAAPAGVEKQRTGGTPGR